MLILEIAAGIVVALFVLALIHDICAWIKELFFYDGY